MHRLGPSQPMAPQVPTSPLDATLVLTVGFPEDEENDQAVVTLGNISLENIPHFTHFVAALTATGTTHRPVVVRYLPRTPALILTYAECQLRDVSHLPLLQLLLDIPGLTSLRLELPLFGPEALTRLKAPFLTKLALRGELSGAYQFLYALHAPALEMLDVRFHRNRWDRLNAADDPTFDPAYTLALPPQSFASLHTVKLEEVEERPRFFEVSLWCAIRPLLHLLTIEDFELRLDKAPLWVSDGDVDVVSRAWPRLRRLVLTCTAPAKRAPASFGGLVYLQTRCWNLVELVLPKLSLKRLPLDLAGDADGSSVEGAQAPSGLVGVPVVGRHPLRTLRVACQTSGTVSSEQCMALGRYVDRLFPNLEPDMQFVSGASADAYVNMSDWYFIWSGIMSAKNARTVQYHQMWSSY